ncbi:MAG: hypothetical protein KDA96_23460 [Planctomycetaceae bacterium]|nr:hypothetical protein [Planctomycetaceae bacterium]
MPKSYTLITVTLIHLLLLNAATADVIFFSPDSVVASNESTFHEGFNTINRSGISGPVTLANIGTVFHTDGGASVLWRGDFNLAPLTLVYSFASPRRIDYAGLWQGAAQSQGVDDFNLSFFDATEGMGNQIGGVYSGILDTDAVGWNNIPLNGRAFSVGPRFGVMSIKMEITSRAVDYNHFVHLGEFMAASVPEPPKSAFVVPLALACWIQTFLRREKRLRT